ncbi:MAG: class I SAM-dependent methyltransferase [Carboxydocellales bacterium]
MALKAIVTTSNHTDFDVQERASWWAETLKCPLICRNEHSETSSFRELAKTNDVDVVVIVGRRNTKLVVDEQQFYFHPGMAKLRVQAVERGQQDQFIAATGLEQGFSHLDCTLGLAADAILASYIVGSSGKVVGVESQSLLATLAQEGLGSYSDENRPLIEAMRKIEVINIQAKNYLTSLPDECYDVVYFDPMFRHTKRKSSAMDLLRTFGNPAPIDLSTIQEALRVARLRVVVKEGRGSGVFDELGISRIVGGKYSAVAYGILVN